MKKKDKRRKHVTSLTNYIIDLPSWQSAVLYTIIISAIVGIVGLILQGQVMIQDGALIGLFLLAIPALLSTFLTTALTKFNKQYLKLKRSAFLSLFGVIFLSVLYLIGSGASVLGNNMLLDMLIFGYVLVFASRVFILMITQPYNMMEAIGLSSIHPILGYLFIYLSKFIFIGFLPVSMISVTSLVLKAVLSLIILTVGILIFILLINAPMKRNFGLNTIKLARAFLAHWNDKSSAIENILMQLGEKVDSLVGIVAFRTKKGLKSVLLVPYLHPGPFGEIGGAKMSGIFTEEIEKKTNAKVFVGHGIVTHDMSPLDTNALYDVANKISNSLKGMKYTKKVSNSVRAQVGKAKVLGQRFGNSVFLVSTFSPEVTEDIDFSVGLAVMNKLEKDFDNVIYSDAHNCYKKGYYYLFSGNPQVFDLFNSTKKISDKLKKSRQNSVKLGISVDSLDEYELEDGIGPAGLRVMVLQTGKQKTAYIIFDANNLVAGLREKIIQKVKKLGINNVEVITTDSHCVNNIRGVDNPLGMRISQSKIVKMCEKNTLEALRNLEPVEVGTKIMKIKDITVLGPQKSIELVSTVNSTIAIMKIVSPIIFGFSLIFSLLSVLLIPW